MITFSPACRNTVKRFRATAETKPANNLYYVLYLLQNFSSRDNQDNTSLAKKPKTLSDDMKS